MPPTDLDPDAHPALPVPGPAPRRRHLAGWRVITRVLAGVHLLIGLGGLGVALWLYVDTVRHPEEDLEGLGYFLAALCAGAAAPWFVGGLVAVVSRRPVLPWVGAMAAALWPLGIMAVALVVDPGAREPALQPALLAVVELGVLGCAVVALASSRRTTTS